MKLSEKIENIAEKVSGRDYKVKHTIKTYQVDKSKQMPLMWRKTYGKPTPQNIKKYVEKFNASLEPGEVNDHLGYNGAIYGGEILDQDTQKIIAKWEDKKLIKKYKVMFQII